MNKHFVFKHTNNIAEKSVHLQTAESKQITPVFLLLLVYFKCWRNKAVVQTRDTLVECGNHREVVSLLWHEIITVFYEERNRFCSALQEHGRKGNYLNFNFPGFNTQRSLYCFQ